MQRRFRTNEVGSGKARLVYGVVSPQQMLSDVRGYPRTRKENAASYGRVCFLFVCLFWGGFFVLFCFWLLFFLFFVFFWGGSCLGFFFFVVVCLFVLLVFVLVWFFVVGFFVLFCLFVVVVAVL